MDTTTVSNTGYDLNTVSMSNDTVTESESESGNSENYSMNTTMESIEIDATTVFFIDVYGYLESLIAISVLSIIALSLMMWSIWVIYSKKRLSSLVRKYFFVEFAARLYLIVFFLSYITPQMFWGDVMGGVPPIVDMLLTFLYMAFSLMCPLAQMALSCNRFLAVAFNGRFYRLLSQKEAIQVFILIVSPLLFHSPVLLPWCTPYNEGEEIYWKTTCGGKCPKLLEISTVISSIIGVVTVVSDICVWRMLKKRRKDLQLQHSNGERAERRLCRHMLLNHISSMTVGFIVGIIANLITSVPFLTEFISNSLYVPILAILQGLILIWFFQSYRFCCKSKEKSDSTTQDDRSKAITRARAASSPMTSVTRQNVTISKMASIQT